MLATTQILTLQQRQAIDLAKESLVLGAENLLNGLDRAGAPRLSHSQVRNLIAIANETESPAVVTNFIRYQIGRAGKNDAWDKPGVSSTGDQLIEEIDNGTVAQALNHVETAMEELRQSLDLRSTQSARMALIRHYLGFVSRYLKYLEKTQPKSKTRRDGGGR